LSKIHSIAGGVRPRVVANLKRRAISRRAYRTSAKLTHWGGPENSGKLKPEISGGKIFLLRGCLTTKYSLTFYKANRPRPFYNSRHYLDFSSSRLETTPYTSVAQNSRLSIRPASEDTTQIENAKQVSRLPPRSCSSSCRLSWETAQIIPVQEVKDLPGPVLSSSLLQNRSHHLRKWPILYQTSQTCLQMEHALVCRCDGPATLRRTKAIRSSAITPIARLIRLHSDGLVNGSEYIPASCLQIGHY
jgi:hypothetical protein